MQQAWIVVREERHIDPRFWVCLERDDALRIASDVTAYWMQQYEPEEVNRQMYENQIFHCQAEDAFRVYVEPQNILSAGEDDN